MKPHFNHTSAKVGKEDPEDETAQTPTSEGLMGWFRGLGRRTGPRLTWNTEAQPLPSSDNYVARKKRTWLVHNLKRGYKHDSKAT